MLKNAIETLAENYDTPLDQLQEYKEIVEQNLDNHELYDIIKQQFRPTIVKVGTAGAYLWGCDQNFYGNVSKSCSPLCSGGISYNNDTNTCQYQIWTYDKELKNIDKASSNIAYIYVGEYWQYFKKSDIKLLKDANVEFVIVLRTEDGKHKTVIPITNINILPVIQENLEEVKEKTNYHYIFFFVLFLVIAIYLVLNYKVITKLDKFW